MSQQYLSQDESPLASKYQSLLLPIKDLAANWNIDIAQHLESFLEEIETLSPLSHSQMNSESLNFAQAALLVQGSAAVYSKKVEHLHQLVFQVLEQISIGNQDKKVANGNKKNDGNSQQKNFPTDEELLAWGDDPSLLMLDDSVIEMATNIDMQKNISDSIRKESGRLSRLSIASDSSLRTAALLHSIMHDESSTKGSLKISSGLMDSSGAIIMGRSSFASRGEISQTSIHVEQLEISHSHQDVMFDNDGWSDNGDMGETFPTDQMDDNGVMNDKDDLQLQLPPTKIALTPLPQKENAHTNVYNNNVCNNNNQSPVSTFEGGYDKQTCLAKVFLNPHESVFGDKPIKKGKCHRTIKPNTKLHSNNTIFSVNKLNETTASTSSSPSLLLLSNVHFKLSRLYQNKKMEFDLRKEKKNNKLLIKEINSMEVLNPVSDNNYIDDHGTNNVYYDNDDDDNNGYPMDDGGFEDQGYDGYGQGNEQETNEYQKEWAENDELLSRVNNVLDGMGLQRDDQNGTMKDARDDSLSGITFENLCRQHLQNFMNHAQLYARETNLSRRVSDWTEKLEPLLNEQELRPVFDIHAYSDEALERVSKEIKRTSLLDMKSKTDSEETKRIPFSDIVQNESRYEVCRMFLACLQLANLGNVTFTQEDSSKNDFNVILLSDQSNRLQMENYIAPSLLA